MTAPVTAAPVRDLTHEVAGVVDWLVNWCVERPKTCSGPWTVNFFRDGKASITYQRAEPHALVVSEPGWYRFIWGPKLAEAAHYYWTYLASDLALVGVRVDVPSPQRCRELYWGPMPVDGPRWSSDGSHRRNWAMPNVAVQAQQARAEFLADLQDNAAPFEPLPYTVERRRPRQEERMARQDARAAAAEGVAPPAPATPAVAPAQSWEPGQWGKGFQSATGKLYTWVCTHPKQGGHPQHGANQTLIAAHEGGSVLATGRALTELDEIGYLCPVLIAPDGTYTAYSADSFWQGSAYLPEQTARRDAVNSRFTADAFTTLPGLRHVESAEKFHEKALGQRGGYGHAGNLLDILNRSSR